MYKKDLVFHQGYKINIHSVYRVSYVRLSYKFDSWIPMLESLMLLMFAIFRVIAT